MNITLDAMEALEAIEREGSFSAAAESLGKVQSAVSYAIRTLESQLGVELFDRSGHRAVMTPAGRAVLEEGRQLLAQARRIEGLAKRFDEGWEPRLDLVVDGILPMEPVLAVLDQVAREGSPTQVQLKVEFLGGVQDRFDADGADLMVVKELVPDEQIVAHALPEIEVVLVAQASHPLAESSPDHALELADLWPHVELTVHDPSASRRVEDTHRFGGPRVFFLSDFYTKKRAIEMGLGFGWMPLYLVRDELASGALVELPYAAGSRYRFIPRLAHRRDRPLGRTGERVLVLLREAFGGR